MKMKPISTIKAELGIEPNGRVQRFFTDACAKHMDKYVPFDTGNLANYHIEGNNFIVYNQIYAHYQYKGISKNGEPLNYHRDKHPLANDYWDKRMWSAEKETVIKEVQDYVNSGR